jgi:hypothetical protein
MQKRIDLARASPQSPEVVPSQCHCRSDEDAFVQVLEGDNAASVGQRTTYSPKR